MTRRERLRRGTIAVVAAASLLSACVTSGAGLSADEQQLRQTERIRLAQGVVGGAVLGAAAGALLAAALGGDDRQIAHGAIAGAAVGGVAGAADAGNVNAHARAQYEQQQSLENQIAAADRNIAEYRKVTDAARRIAASERASIARLNGEFARGEVTAAQYRAELVNARGNLAALTSQIRNAEQDIADLDQSGASGHPAGASRKARLVEEKTRLEQERATLERIYLGVPSQVGRYS